MENSFFSDQLFTAFNERVDERFKRANISVPDIPPTIRQKILEQAAVAQAFLDNNPLAVLWIQHRLALIDNLRTIHSYRDEAEKERLSITHKILGLDSFIDFLQELILLAKKIKAYDPNSTKRTRTTPKPVGDGSGTKPVLDPGSTDLVPDTESGKLTPF